MPVVSAFEADQLAAPLVVVDAGVERDLRQQYGAAVELLGRAVGRERLADHGGALGDADPLARRLEPPFPPPCHVRCTDPCDGGAAEIGVRERAGEVPATGGLRPD